MATGVVQIALFCAVLVATVPLLGGYMARVFGGDRVFLTPVVGPLERGTYRLLRVDLERGQGWKAYARSLLVFSLLFWLLLYLILRTQGVHPWNPGGLRSGGWDLSFNTTTSFVTNTNWQFYGGETTLTYFSQMAGLAVQNFVSAAVGICVVVALIRGIAARRGDGYIGSFWTDLERSTYYVLLPLSIVGALFLVSQGVVQTLGGSVDFTTLAGKPASLAVGPVASQEAIKELGTNGGGFFNVNSAFPFENPNGISNFLELWLILSIPASLTYTYGRMVGSRRQGWTIFSAMAALFVAAVVVVYLAERHGTPAQHLAGIAGGNLEGKEQRFGIAGSSLWAVVTTVTSCGAVNAAMESLTGLGGALPMWNMGLSEVVFGGAGSGLYTMLLFVLLAVFVGGLMVGRTPEYLGKRIEARDVRLVAVGALWTALVVLVFTALAVGTRYGAPSISASGPQGFSESLYAYLSQANNNGSAFAGYTGVTFADVAGGFAMLLGRFVPMLATLAVAGSLAGKRFHPASAGTLRTDTPTFVSLLLFTVILVGALTMVPALLLGPVVQSLTTQVF
jgi:K+-transporting ATPase ATPase A chain